MAADEPMLLRRAGAEFVGTGLLVVAVVGSGIAAQRLSPSDAGVQLLENAVVTGCALVAIILALGPLSGAHLNPVISAADAVFRGLRPGELVAYIAAQLAGGLAGTAIANLMFSLPAFSASTHGRTGSGLWLGEVVATFGLLLVVFGLARGRSRGAAPFAVGAYITGAYFFTSSTSFANPAVTVARMFTDTFSGIAPGSVLGFVAAEVVGAGLAVGAVRLLWPRTADVAGLVVVPHEEAGRVS
ncbi:MAG: aquaporin [Candidatus Dormibacteria bacterium]